MKRLYHKIYLTIIVSLLMVVVVAGAIWRAGWETSPAGQAFEMAGELAAAVLPPPDAPRALQQQAIERFAHQIRTDLALYDAGFSLIAGDGAPLPVPPNRERGGGSTVPRGPAWSFHLPDGRGSRRPRPGAPSPPRARLDAFSRRHRARGRGLSPIRSCAGSPAGWSGCRGGVETLGAGDLSARVKVEGRDEVARLAASFNRSAARIEELVNAHRMLLSNASHELRTPLSRIRLGVELYKETGDPKYKAELDRDIAELDLWSTKSCCQPPRRHPDAAGERGGRSAGARGRGMRAQRLQPGRSPSPSAAIRGCCAA